MLLAFLQISSIFNSFPNFMMIFFFFFFLSFVNAKLCFCCGILLARGKKKKRKLKTIFVIFNEICLKDYFLPCTDIYPLKLQCLFLLKTKKKKRKLGTYIFYSLKKKFKKINEWTYSWNSFFFVLTINYFFFNFWCF